MDKILSTSGNNNRNKQKKNSTFTSEPTRKPSGQTCWWSHSKQARSDLLQLVSNTLPLPIGVGGNIRRASSLCGDPQCTAAFNWTRERAGRAHQDKTFGPPRRIIRLGCEKPVSSLPN